MSAAERKKAESKRKKAEAKAKAEVEAKKEADKVPQAGRMQWPASACAKRQREVPGPPLPVSQQRDARRPYAHMPPDVIGGRRPAGLLLYRRYPPLPLWCPSAVCPLTQAEAATAKGKKSSAKDKPVDEVS